MNIQSESLLGDSYGQCSSTQVQQCVLQCSVLQYSSVRCNAVQGSAAQFSAVQFSAVQVSVVRRHLEAVTRGPRDAGGIKMHPLPCTLYSTLTALHST